MLSVIRIPQHLLKQTGLLEKLNEVEGWIVLDFLVANYTNGSTSSKFVLLPAISEIKERELPILKNVKDEDVRRFLQLFHSFGIIQLRQAQDNKIYYRIVPAFLEKYRATLQPHTTASQQIQLISKPNDKPSETKKKTTKPPLQQRAKEYMVFAEWLARIVKKKKNIQYPARQLQQWSNEFRRLVEENGVTRERIANVLEWYEGALGSQYIPVVESGYSFRTKFLRLEDAMERYKKEKADDVLVPGSDTKKIRRIFDEAVKSEGLNEYTSQFLWQKIVYAVCGMSPTERKESEWKDLMYGVVELWVDLERMRKQARSTDTLPSVLLLMERYVNWLQQNSNWIEHIAPNSFSIKSSLFARFRTYEARHDCLGRDPITGVPTKHA